jgi:mono/diheme cytochrome c family protein
MTKVNTILLTTMLTAGFAAAADSQAGKAAYDKSCKSCHGVAGAPNAAIAKSLKVEMRDLASKEVQALSDSELKIIITDGKGKMRPVKAASGADVDNMVAYMRTLKK